MNTFRDEEICAAAAVVIVFAPDTDAAQHTAVVTALSDGGLIVRALTLPQEDTTGARVALIVTATYVRILDLHRNELLREYRNAELVELAIKKHALTDADAVRLVHAHITTAKYSGGCGVRVRAHGSDGVVDAVVKAAATAGADASTWAWVGGAGVTDILTLHDVRAESLCLHRWLEMDGLMDTRELSHARALFGEEIALSLAFAQFYLLFHAPVAVLGVVAFAAWGDYSIAYAGFLGLWSIMFLEAWKRQEKSFAKDWGTLHADSAADRPRPAFAPDRIDIDPVTHRPVLFYPRWKRWIIHAFFTFPVLTAFALTAASFSFAYLTLDIYTFEIYDGWDRLFVIMLPSAIYVLVLPLFQTFHTKLSKYITKLENSEGEYAHESSYSSKAYVMSCLLSQLSVLVLGLVYIPAADILIPKVKPILEGLGVYRASELHHSSSILSPHTFQNRIISFAVSQQLVNQFLQIVVPSLLASWTTVNMLDKAASSLSAADTTVALNATSGKHQSAVIESDSEIIQQISEALKLPEYSSYDYYAAIANQFSLVVMFSGAWPLVPLLCVFNNFLDLRTNAFKLIKSSRRPIPRRTSSIKPWLKIFNLLAVVGTLATATTTLIYRNWDVSVPASAQTLAYAPAYLLALILVEHLFFFTQWLVAKVIQTAWGDLYLAAEKALSWERRCGADAHAAVTDFYFKTESARKQHVEIVTEVVAEAMGHSGRAERLAADEMRAAQQMAAAKARVDGWVRKFRGVDPQEELVRDVAALVLFFLWPYYPPFVRVPIFVFLALRVF
ncbi:hypothetical protein HDU84_003931 [Entophlyctis sp. JEL0112]|nr:hypothetical protein HDU84_003931 [Entophlyctis sp. JEL0112]